MGGCSTVEGMVDSVLVHLYLYWNDIGSSIADSVEETLIFVDFVILLRRSFLTL